jgi:formylglycine-generating enzyme required for sulfatase activity
MKSSTPFLALLTSSLLLLAASQAHSQTRAAGSALRDCAGTCPEMVSIPPGSFTMGSPDSEAGRYDVEGPQVQVTIGYSFLIGKYDVTRSQYAEFVAETQRPDPADCDTLNASGRFDTTPGANWHNPGFAQTGSDPVVCVSWEDATAYAAWLSQKTGHTYRLPSEAEFEYAARAGTTTPRYIGTTDAELCRYYNLGDLDYSAAHPQDNEIDNACHDGYSYTSPVGSFPPNPFGLYDMLGNVLQWTEDCWNPNHDGAPTNGSAQMSGTCGRRVWRGGCWIDDGKYIRAAYRNGGTITDRQTHMGFRVVRTN